MTFSRTNPGPPDPTTAPDPRDRPGRRRARGAGLSRWVRPRRIAVVVGLLALAGGAFWRWGIPFLQRARAEVALSRGDEAGASRIALDQLRQNPSDAHAARLAAIARIRSGSTVLASEWLLLAESDGSAEPSDWLELALLMLRLGRGSDAELALRTGLDHHPKAPVLLQRLAALLHYQGRNDEALVFSDRLSRLRPRSPFAYALQAMLHHEEGRPRHAYESALRVLELDPDLANSPVDPAVFWTDLTADLIDLGNAARAAELLRHELARRPELPAALAACLQENLGRSSAVAGDLGSAAEAYRRAVGLDPARYRSLMGAAQASLREGDPAEAVPLLERAVGVDPTTPDAHYTLSIAYRMLGREGAAAEALREHAERSRGRPQTSGMGYQPGREAAERREQAGAGAGPSAPDPR